MAAKIKDGLFIGDAETSQSEVFINDNKISNLINLAGREVHNVWASHGLVYLTYYWEDRPDYKLFTNHEDALLTDIVEFIDVSISHGISVLLFSRNGTGRCVVAACLYLMMKYRWGFEKTYDYVYSKKPDIDLNKGFIQQMFALDMKLLAARQKAYAAKNGIENKFKIEANMTISDISRMLPPEEAKRWNAWDPDYVLEGSTEAGGGMDGESKGGEGSGGRYKDSKEFKRADSRRSSPGSRPNNSVAISGPGTGEDDELILIYSFLNSKNTITVLPGPYLDVYETHKNFKLKFNPICFEEDVNWFPSASVVPARASMKGSRAKLAAAQASAQPKVYSSAPHSSSMAENKRDAKFGDAPSSGSFSSNPKSVVALENIAPMYIINSQRENRDRGLAADGTSYNNSSGNSSSNGTSAQMYYSHPAMTTAPGDHHYNADQDVSPPTSAPSSAHSSPAHTNPYAAHSINNNSNNSNSANNAGGGGGGGMSRQGSNVSITSMGSHSQAAQSYSSDLYEFVGISTVDGVRGKTSREGPQRTWGPRDSIAVHKDKDQHHAAGSDNSSVHSSSHHSHRGGFPEEYKEEVQAQVSRDPRQQPPPPPQQPHHQQQQQLSAEDRLRNLMADMQRHKPTSSSAVAAAPGAGASGGHHSRHHTSNSSSRGAERESSRPEARSEPSGPSLYELATMQIGSGGGGAGSRGSSHGGGYPQGGGGGGVDDIEEEDLADPLSAFQRQQQHQQYAGSSSGGGSKGASSAGGAVRARHDIITHNSSGSGRPGSAGPVGRSAVGSSVPGPRTAWASGTGPSPVPSSSGSAGVRGVSPSSSRASSPSPGAVGGSGGGAGRSASPVGPSKRMVGGAGSVSSNLSVNSINSSGSNQVVGSGISSGSKVYRHGSPAPNTRPGVRSYGAAPVSSSGVSSSGVSRQHVLASSSGGGAAAASRRERESLQASGGSIANSSVSSLGSGIVGANNAAAYSTARYPAGGAPGVDPSTRPGSSARYASPSSAQQQGRPRSANASAASLYSSEALDSNNPATSNSRVRRSVNSSPLRASSTGTSGGGLGGIPGSGSAPKRYSTPTPQPQQQYAQYQQGQDFDSTASGGSARDRAPLSRSGTPTRATWKF